MIYCIEIFVESAIISSLTVDKLKKCHNPCKYKGCGTFICIHEI